MTDLPVLLVTTWDQPCGIAEHAFYLKESIEAADPQIHIEVESTGTLHPASVLNRETISPVVILNYQAGLLSQWHPEHLRQVQARGSSVVVIYHDTGVPNSDQCKALYQVADVFIVHEPAKDLPQAIYWRMGVPAAGNRAMQYGRRFRDTPGFVENSCFKAWDGQLVLGSIGFPSGWKNYDQLAKVTAEVGWALLLIAPGATAAQIAGWAASNPNLTVWPTFTSRLTASALLAGCDATAFCYVCHNTGQSGAILQGIAARKPVHALATCRQFRALFNDKLGRTAITWTETFEDLAFNLSHFTRIERVHPPIVALAEQESWSRLGRKFAGLCRELREGA